MNLNLASAIAWVSVVIMIILCLNHTDVEKDLIDVTIEYMQQSANNLNKGD